MDPVFIKSASRVLSGLPRGSTVYSGLSGGADSVCLLLVLSELCPRYGLSLAAVHVNHNLRGEESDRDQHFCEELCRRKNIPLSVFSVDVASYANRTGLSTETAARELRYRAFADAAGKDGYIATAHNLNDNAETVIFNMTRGTGLKGLCGIPPVRDNIIRPLLGVTRAEIEDYLKDNGQDHVTDSTNLTEDYSRNKIRKNVIPVLCEINSGFLHNIAGMTESLREDEYCLENISDEDFSAVRKRKIIKLIRDAGAEPDRDMIERVEELPKKGGKTQLCGDLFAYIENGELKTERIIPDKNAENFSAPLTCGETDFPGDKIVCVETIKISDIHNFLTNNAFDYDKIVSGAVIRTRRAGDRIMLPGENFHRELRKIYNSKKIPPHKRDTAVVIADDEGIVWAEYCGASARAVCGENTRTAAAVAVRRKNT